MEIWNLTLFAVHLAFLIGALFLYPSAPCWLQKLVIAGFITGFAIGALAFLLTLVGHPEWRWPVYIIGLLFTQGAAMLLIFRLIYRGHLEWTSSAQSLSLHR